MVDKQPQISPIFRLLTWPCNLIIPINVYIERRKKRAHGSMCQIMITNANILGYEKRNHELWINVILQHAGVEAPNQDLHACKTFPFLYWRKIFKTLSFFWSSTTCFFTRLLFVFLMMSPFLQGFTSFSHSLELKTNITTHELQSCSSIYEVMMACIFCKPMNNF